MKKRTRLMLLMWIAAFCALSGLLHAQYLTSTNNGQVTITGYTGSGGSVTIPNTTNSLPITGIGANAFSWKSTITHMTMGSNITWIGSYAFYGCTGMTGVTLPGSVTNIESYAFDYCTDLTSVTIPSGVATLGNGAFMQCSALTTVSVPGTLTNIGSQVFCYCSTLTGINVNASNPWYSSTNGVLFDHAQQTLIAYPENGPANYNVPGTVVAIGPYAFDDCSALVNVALSNNVATIGDYAFYDCSALTNVMFGTGLTSIGNSSFGYCSSLSCVTLCAGVTSIGNNAFYECSTLSCIGLPATLTSIGNDAFACCSALTAIYIPANVTSIGQSAFQGCSALSGFSVDPGNLWYSSLNGVLFDMSQDIIIECPPAFTGAYIIPGTVTTIGPSAFQSCLGLTSIIIPTNVTTIDDNAFSGCSALTQATIPDSVTFLGNSVFSSCTALQGVFVGNNVTVIGNNDFSFCSSLISVVIGTNVTSIESQAFYADLLLPNITIPISVTNIGSYAFEDDQALVSVWIPNSVTSIGSYAFDSCMRMNQVMMGNGMAFLGSEAFGNCTNVSGFYFNGNAPTLQDSSVFSGDSLATVYFLIGATGWGSTYGGLQTASFAAGPPAASPVSVTTIQNTPVDITLPVTSTTLPSYQLICSVSNAPVHGTVTLQYPTLAPTDSCYVIYTPTNGFVGTDTFTFVANDGAYNSNISTATVVVAAETPPVVQGIHARTTPGIAITLTLSFTQPALDRQILPLTSFVVAQPVNGTVSGGVFAPGYTPTLTYTPNSGFNGVDSFTFALFDGVHTSNVANATIEVLQPEQHGSNLVLLVVNSLLLPEITSQIAQLQNDLIADGYSASIVSWSNPTNSVLWKYLSATYTNFLQTSTFLEGAILIGNIPADGCTDLDYWNLATNIQTTSSGSVYNPGPYQIWVSRMWGVVSYAGNSANWGDEPTMIQRALQANHAYRTGASRLPQTVFAFDRAYGAEMNASQFQPPWTNVMELSTGPSDTPDSYSHPLGCYEAFLRGGDLLAEESHGQGDLYTINMGGIWTVDEPGLNHRLVQVRTILNSSCEAGALGSIVNAQLLTRGGGNVLSIGASETTWSGAVIPDLGQIPALATGLSWGDALLQHPLSDNSFLIYYGDLSLPILNSPTSNAMPVVSMTATLGGTSATGYSVTNYMGTAAPVLKGIPPMTVNFTSTASSPMNAIALAEWWGESYDFGRATPDATATNVAPQTYTYYRAHRWLPRMEVMDSYQARSFAETEIRVGPRSDKPLRIVCGLADEWVTYARPSLDYLSPSNGKLWLQDQPYALGTWGASSGLAFGYGGYGQVYSGPVVGTSDPKIFQYAQHYNSQCSQYTIPISNGTYMVNLGFADAWSITAGSRIFDIYINGAKVNTVEPFVLAGYRPDTAVIVPTPVTVTSNLCVVYIGLNAASTATNASISAFLNNIEVIPTGYTNHPPVAGNISASTFEGQGTNLNVVASCSDPDGDEIILTSVSTPANGSTSISNNGVFYTPRNGFAGTDTFNYVICDGNGGFATGLVTMAVAGAYGNSPTVAPQATPSVGAPPLVVTFTANATAPNSSPLTYTWNLGDGYGSTNQNPVHTYTNAGVYTVTLTASDSYGNTGIGQITVAASAAPVITQQPVSAGAPAGQATFTVTATGAPYPSYQWFCNGTALTGATNATYILSNASYGNFGALYTVTASNVVGVVTSQVVTLYAGLVSFEPSTWPSGWMPPSGYSVDEGALLNAAVGYGWTSATAVAGGVIRYPGGNADPRLDAFAKIAATPDAWCYYVPNGVYVVTVSCGDAGYSSGPALVQVQGTTAINSGTLSANQFAAATNVQATVTNGILTLTVGGTTGNTDINYVMIQRSPSVITLSASATPTNGIMPLAVQFTATGSENDGNPVTYAWIFGDGGFSTNQNPLYAYTNAGSYIATVVANSYGSLGSLSATSTIPVTVTSNLRTLTTSTAGFGTGTINLNPGGGTYLTGVVVTVTAVSGSNSVFTGWSGDLSGTNNPTTITMNNSHSVIANFGYEGYGITASAGAGGSISPSGSVGVLEGGSQAFTITPSTWHVISNVVVDSVSIGALSAYTFSNISTSHVITAYFRALLAPLGTPLWWLAQYGYTNNEQAVDINGTPVWKDYQEGMNPNAPGTGPAYNIVPYAEGFENLNAWGGVYTNIIGVMGWTSVTGMDQSKIMSLIYTYNTTNLPLPAITHTNVLALNTQWATLTNSFGSGFNMSQALTYLDMMVQMVPYVTGTPAAYTSADTGTRGGVYANANNQLTIYHGVATNTGALLSNNVDTTSVTVTPGSWHRLTLAIDATCTNSANALAMFQVLLDGNVITNANAYDGSWKTQFQNTGVLPATSPTGTWFRFATTNAAAKNLTGLYFTGTGYVDDLMATTLNPFATTCWLIVTSTGGGFSSLGPGLSMSVPINLGATTQIVYSACEWNRIASLMNNGVTVPSVSGMRFFTQTLVNVSATVSNAVAFAPVASNQTGYGNVPISWLTNWTEEAIQTAQGCDGFCVHDKYLLGLDPTSSNTCRLIIDSISVSGSNIVIVARRDVTGALAIGGMNGSLTLQAALCLTNAVFTNLPASSITGATVFDGTSHHAYTNIVDKPSKHYRVIVQ